MTLVNFRRQSLETSDSYRVIQFCSNVVLTFTGWWKPEKVERKVAWLLRKWLKWYMFWNSSLLSDSFAALVFIHNIMLSLILEQREPEVKFHSIGIISDEFGEIITPLPVNENQGGRVLFTLREGSRYQLRLTFTVMHNIVSGLSYSNKVWRGGLLGT